MLINSTTYTESFNNGLVEIVKEPEMVLGELGGLCSIAEGGVAETGSIGVVLWLFNENRGRLGVDGSAAITPYHCGWRMAYG